MANYADTKIYKLVCNKTGLIYIGSTTQKYLSIRLSTHRNDYEKYQQGLCNYITSFKILENADYNIVLLEKYECKNVDEKNARERFYIENNECVNRQIPGRTKKEWTKQYYDKNKDKMNEKHNCDICKGKYALKHLQTHNKTKKHMDAMNAL